MHSETIFTKTAKGREEMEQRNYHLPPMVRRLLILIDGTLSVDDLEDDLGAMLPIKKTLTDLEKNGFIVDIHAANEPLSPAPALDLEMIKRRVADVIFRDLGDSGRAVVMQLIACHDLDQLNTHMMRLRAHYENQFGNERAQHLWSAYTALTGAT